jgi:hypothetical protein
MQEIERKIRTDDGIGKYDWVYERMNKERDG